MILLIVKILRADILFNSKHFNKLPCKLSGWKRQRVAIWEDRIKTAFDELTTNLDHENSEIFLNILKKMSNE